MLEVRFQSTLASFFELGFQRVCCGSDPSTHSFRSLILPGVNARVDKGLERCGCKAEALRYTA
jgi:hypothetical protein